MYHLPLLTRESSSAFDILAGELCDEPVDNSVEADQDYARLIRLVHQYPLLPDY